MRTVETLDEQSRTTLLAYRLIDPGSEWRPHRQWYGDSAMGDLLGEDFALARKDKPYRCLELLVSHREALFMHLRQRWGELFEAQCEVLLHDLTSTYFESVPPQDASSKRRFGYSRDHRPDCTQVVVALVVTPATFNYQLDRGKLRHAIRREGLYLLPPRIEQACKELKSELALRPVYHQHNKRIEAHIFVSFLAYCPHATLTNLARRHAGGLTARAILEKLSTIVMIDVHLPTTDDREIRLSRYTEPDADVELLLNQLNPRLPTQPPPRIHDLQSRSP